MSNRDVSRTAAWTTAPTIAWFTGEPIRTLCGLEGKPMRPGKQRSGVETGRREPYED